MEIIAPDLLVEMRELPMLAKLVTAGVGLCLWAAGWWMHRFWVVVFATLGAGLLGLHYAPQYQMQPMVGGLLAAVAAGTLALALARLAVFAACGFGCWYAAHVLAPHWESPAICVMGGGLAGVLLFRLCMIVLTSAGGALIMGHSGLILAESFNRNFNAVNWVGEKSLWVNGGFGVTVFLGVLVQYLIERARRRYQERHQDWEEWERTHREKEELEERRSWNWFRRRAA